MSNVIHLRRALLVALGGALGTAARLGLTLLIPDAGGFPFAIITANVVGAFLIGILTGWPADMPTSRADLRIFLGTGVLGGFTTYSAFTVGSIQLWTDAPVLALLYAALSLVLGVAAAVAGIRLARSGAAT
ncbi:CrcB protein [Microbacterium sp. ZKA21]